MIVRPEKVRTTQTNRPITKSGSFRGASNNTDVLGHALILLRWQSGFTIGVTGEDAAQGTFPHEKSHLTEPDGTQ
jgi:hypothetical protein